MSVFDKIIAETATLRANHDALLAAAEAVISFIENENLAVTEDLAGEHLSGCRSAAYHLSQQTDDLPPIECLCGTTALRAAVQQAKGGVE